MTRQTWTAFVAAACFVGLAIALVVVPVPFVTWTPGGARNVLGEASNQPMIDVKGIETFPTSGELDMTVVAETPVDGKVSLPQALLTYWLPHRDTLPRASVYRAGKTAAQVDAESSDQMSTAQDDAIVAALRAANQPVTAMPVIYSVTVGGPAHTKLLPGDLVVSVDGINTPDVDSVSHQIRVHKVGDTVNFVVLRDGVRTEVAASTVESSTQAGLPIIGVELSTGYKYAPQISFDLGQQIGGPSAGLVFALAIYDKVTAGALLSGRHIAGTGQITADGDVGVIGAIQEKIAAAEKAGATAFLVPAPNCQDLAGVRTDMQLIKVSTLHEAIDAVRALGAGDTAALPRCP